MNVRCLCVATLIGFGLSGLAAPTAACLQPSSAGGHPSMAGARPSAAASWREAEAETLSHQVQLTFADQFYKAGEAYLSPQGDRIMFQAIEPPTTEEEPPEIFEMYIADVLRDGEGYISGIENVRRLSPQGSSNTCAWFNPDDRDIVYFASTLTPIEAPADAGYDEKTKRYVWAKPGEMRVFQCDLSKPHGSPESLTLLAGDGSAYQAEGSLSVDRRHFLYCSLEAGEGDLYVKDLKTGKITCVVAASGYDGGPFFSPDGKRICYRSDRYSNSLLQIFVADLKFDDDGAIVGIEREYQLTDNSAVNFGPYFHPEGRHIIYASSEVGMGNFEVFVIDADPGDLPGSPGPIKYGTHKRRLTFSDRADLLPTMASSDTTVVWTSQRGPGGKSQIWAGELVLDLDAIPTRGGGRPGGGHPGSGSGEGGHPGGGHPGGGPSRQ